MLNARCAANQARPVATPLPIGKSQRLRYPLCNIELKFHVLAFDNPNLIVACVIGDGVMFGGRAGVGDHIHIGDGARLAAGCGVLKDVPAGETWAGLPARSCCKAISMC